MWPKDAVPESVVDDLFERLTAIYGQRFVDMWHRSNPNVFRETWGLGLKGLSPAQIRRGIAACFHAKYAPTLPEFLEFCIAVPEHRAPSLPALTHEHRITPVGLAQKAKIDAILAKHRLPKREPSAGTDGIKWAFKILREANERDVPLNKLAIAQQAIANWCATHGCSRDDLDESGDWTNTPHARQIDDVELPPRVPSPHIVDDGVTHVERVREPGDDDEELPA